MEYIAEASLLKRIGTTEEIAAATAFKASDDASYIAGETLVLLEECPLGSKFVID